MVQVSRQHHCWEGKCLRAWSMISISNNTAGHNGAHGWTIYCLLGTHDGAEKGVAYLTTWTTRLMLYLWVAWIWTDGRMDLMIPK